MKILITAREMYPRVVGGESQERGKAQQRPPREEKQAGATPHRSGL